MRRRGRAPNQDSAADLIGVDHVYLTVSDFAGSSRFYDRLMRALGFKKGTAAIGGEPHCHYYNRSFQVSIRPGTIERLNMIRMRPGYTTCLCESLTGPPSIRSRASCAR